LSEHAAAKTCREEDGVFAQRPVSHEREFGLGINPQGGEARLDLSLHSVQSYPRDALA
jgi:hypothetical protein